MSTENFKIQKKIWKIGKFENLDGKYENGNFLIGWNFFKFGWKM